MDIFDQAVAKLKADDRTTSELERLSGIPYATLRDIINGTTKNPLLATLKRLAAFYGLLEQPA